MKHEALIERLATTCHGLDPVDPLRLLVDDVVAALAQPEQEPKIGCVNHDCDQCKAQPEQTNTRPYYTIDELNAWADEKEKQAWRNAAIRIGEELSSVGPDGYYDMTAQQWLDWSMAQEPRGKNSLAQLEQEPVAWEQFYDPKRAQDMLQDVLTMGSAWSRGGERIDPMSVYKDFEPEARPENNGGKTGWPPGLLQDDCNGLSKWLSNQPDARRRVREALASVEHTEQAPIGYLMDKPTAWYDPSNGVVSTDRDCPLFTPLGQVWPLSLRREWVGLTLEQYVAINSSCTTVDQAVGSTERQLKENNK
jgi:hypothetical protein